MEIDELKKHTKKRKTPDAFAGSFNDENKKINSLIMVLKEEDKKIHKSIQRVKLMFAGFSMFYLAILLLTFILPPDSDPVNSRISLAFYTIIFITLFLYSLSKLSKLKKISYTEPATEFLKNALERYQLINVNDLKFAIPMLLLLFFMGGFSWLNVYKRYFSSMDDTGAAILYSLFFIGILSIGLYFTKADWKKKKSAVYSEIREMLSGLERENNAQTELNKE